jgi:hypothetical protein
MEMKCTDMHIDATKIMQDNSSGLMITKLNTEFRLYYGFPKSLQKIYIHKTEAYSWTSFSFVCHLKRFKHFKNTTIQKLAPLTSSGETIQPNLFTVDTSE